MSICSCKQEVSHFSDLCDESFHDSNMTTMVDSINQFTIQIPNYFIVQPPIQQFIMAAIDTTDLRPNRIINTITVEKYDLKKDQDFEEFYSDIASRTTDQITNETNEVFYSAAKDIEVTSRPAKYSVIGFERDGLNFKNANFYIKDDQTIFVVSLGTTKDDYQAEFCKLYQSVESIKVINTGTQQSAVARPEMISQIVNCPKYVN